MRLKIVTRRLLLWLIWLGFIIYVLFLAPPVQPDTLQPIQSLLVGQLPSIITSGGLPLYPKG